MSAEAEIRDLWQRLERWATAHAPAMLEDLAPPAGSDGLDELSARIGLELPDALRASLLLHDGETGAAGNLFADAGVLLGCDAIAERWAQLLDLAEEPDPEEAAELLAGEIYAAIDGPVHAVAFRIRWLPILDMNGDRMWYLDFDPAPGGKPGQVIEVDLECTSWRVVADDYAAFLRCYVEALESGIYDAIDERGLPRRSAELDEERRAQQGQAAAIDAFRGAEVGAAELARLAPGSEVELVALLVDSIGDDHELSLRGGSIYVHGDLPAIAAEDELQYDDIWLRVRIRVAKRGWLRTKPHEVLGWSRL